MFRCSLSTFSAIDFWLEVFANLSGGRHSAMCFPAWYIFGYALMNLFSDFCYQKRVEWNS
jgi:hypothetical protein